MAKTVVSIKALRYGVVARRAAVQTESLINCAVSISGNCSQDESDKCKRYGCKQCMFAVAPLEVLSAAGKRQRTDALPMWGLSEDGPLQRLLAPP